MAVGGSAGRVAGPEGRKGVRSELLERAHQRGLVVHAYTFRNEVRGPAMCRVAGQLCLPEGALHAQVDLSLSGECMTHRMKVFAGDTPPAHGTLCVAVCSSSMVL